MADAILEARGAGKAGTWPAPHDLARWRETPDAGRVTTPRRTGPLGTYSTSWIRSSKVRLSTTSRATSG
jgi:hypothetical protein